MARRAHRTEWVLEGATLPAPMQPPPQDTPPLLASVGAVLRPGDHRLVATWALGMGCKVLLAGEDGAPGALVEDVERYPVEGDPALMGISWPRGAQGVGRALDELSRTAVARSLVLMELAGTDVDDAACEALLRMVRLVRLDVSDSRVGPRGLEWLRALPEMELLRAEGVEGGAAAADDGRDAPLDAGLAPAALATRRMLARGLELALVRLALEAGWPGAEVLGFSAWLWFQVMLGAATAVAALVLEVACGLLGVRSPGKALLGLEVTRAEGGAATLSRPVRVWIQGLALGIPPLWIVAGLRGLWRLASGGRAPWDARCGTVVVARSVAAAREGFAWALFLGSTAWLLFG